MRFLFLLASFVFLQVVVFPATIFVPDNFPTIQGAIDASVNGDTVMVRPGAYVENIDFIGKAITVRSEMGPEFTIMRPQTVGSLVSFKSGEGPDSVIEGFTITGGNSAHGGGIFCTNSSSPVITRNVIHDNRATGNGGGISCRNFSAPLISYNTITDNRAIDNGGGIHAMASNPTIWRNRIKSNGTDSRGGGLRIYNCAPIIEENVICRNWAKASGGGISCEDISDFEIQRNILCNNSGSVGGGIHCQNISTMDFNGNIIANNYAVYNNDGIYCAGTTILNIINNTIAGNSASGGCVIGCYGPNTSSIVTNTILRNNGFSEMLLLNNSSLTISYSNVEGGQPSIGIGSGCTLNWGAGMIDDDPLFVDAANNDLHLTWFSPCGNAGDNSVVNTLLDFEGNPRIVGTTVDIGADEFYYHLYHTGDVLPGGTVDLKVIGYPLAPVTLAWGQAILNPPLATQHGNLFIWPFVWSGFIGNVQSNGVLTMPVTIPSGWQSGDHAPLQALVGPWGGGWTKLTNLEVVTVE